MPSYPTPQPLKAELALRRMQIKELAERTGRTPAWVGRVINGYAAPSSDFRKAVAAILHMPQSALFRRAGPADHWGQRQAS